MRAEPSLPRIAGTRRLGAGGSGRPNRTALPRAASMVFRVLVGGRAHPAPTMFFSAAVKKSFGSHPPAFAMMEAIRL